MSLHWNHREGLVPELDLPRLEGDQDDPHFGENEALWLWDAEAQVGFHLYLRTLPYAYRLRRETVNVFFGNASVLVSRQDGPGRPMTPPGGRASRAGSSSRLYVATIPMTPPPAPPPPGQCREGLLPDGTVVLLSFDIDATMAVPPWVTGTFSSGEALERARQSFGGHRYEQLLRATGTIRVRDCYGAPGIEPFGDRDVNARRWECAPTGWVRRNLASFSGHPGSPGCFRADGPSG